MEQYTKEELTEALQVVDSTISKCEKIHPKFAEGTSQHTLLKNRIKAMYISKALIVEDDVIAKYSKEEMLNALPPVTSIINKCEKAQQKFEVGTANYKRFIKMIKAMYISKALIINELDKQG